MFRPVDLQPYRPGALLDPALLDDERLRFRTTACADGSTAAISAQFVARGVAGFALGVTLPSARRGGHWSRHARLRLVPVVRHTLWHRTR